MADMKLRHRRVLMPGRMGMLHMLILVFATLTQSVLRVIWVSTSQPGLTRAARTTLSGIMLTELVTGVLILI